MYEVKIELPGEAPKVFRNLQRPVAAEKVMEEMTAWLKSGKGKFKPREMTMDGPLILDVTDNEGNVVGKASAYAQPMPSRQLTGRFKDLQKLMKQHTNANALADSVVAVISEVVDRRWPGYEKINLIFTVQDCLDTPGFWMSKAIVRDMAAAYVGRFVRKAGGIVGLNIDDPAVMERCIPILESTNQAEKDCIKIVQDRLVKKYGTADHDAAKIKALEDRLLAVMPDSNKDL